MSLNEKKGSINKSMLMLPLTMLLDSRCFIPNRSTVIVQFVIEKIISCHLSFSCWHLIFLFVLYVARCAFELITNHLLNNPMKSVQKLMTDLSL